MSWFQKLKAGLSKSSKKVTESLASLPSLSALIGKSKLDAASLEEVEDALISADLGTASAGRLAAALKAHKFDGPVDQSSIAAALASGLEAILTPVAKPLVINPENRPHVVLLVGVNGSGKTTTAGKLAQQWQAEGKKVMLAAGDTFRAAAIEQLQVWGARTGTTVIADATGGDAAALAYRALAQAKEDAADVLIIDTAGRLQNRTEFLGGLFARFREEREVPVQVTILQCLFEFFSEFDGFISRNEAHRPLELTLVENVATELMSLLSTMRNDQVGFALLSCLLLV